MSFNVFAEFLRRFTKTDFTLEAKFLGTRLFKIGAHLFQNEE